MKFKKLTNRKILSIIIIWKGRRMESDVDANIVRVSLMAQEVSGI